MVQIRKIKVIVLLLMILISCNSINEKPDLKLNNEKPELVEYIVIQENGTSLYSTSISNSDVLIHLPLFYRVKYLSKTRTSVATRNNRIFVQSKSKVSNKIIGGWVNKQSIKRLSILIPDTRYLKSFKSMQTKDKISKIVIYFDKRGIDSYPNTNILNICNDFYKDEICHFALFRNTKFVDFHKGCLPTKWLSNSEFECQQNLNDGGCSNRRVWNISSKNFKKTIIWEQSICYESDPRTSYPTITMCKEYTCLYLNIDKNKKIISTIESIKSINTKTAIIKYTSNITMVNRNGEFCINVDKKELCYDFKSHEYRN